MGEKMWIIKTARIIAIFLLAMLLLIILQPSVYGSDENRAIYPMDGINSQHNFQSNYSAKANDGYLLDVREVPSDTVGWVFDDKYMYVLKGFDPVQYIVVKYDIHTRKVIWSTDNNFRFETSEPCPAAFYNDTLYVYIGRGWREYVNNYSTVPWSTESLWAISAKEGHVKWGYSAFKALAEYYHVKLKKLSTFGMPYYPLTVDDDGTIYIVARGNYNSTEGIKYVVAIIAVNPNGTTKWIFPVEKELLEATIPKGVAIDKQGNIYALSGHYLYALNKNGTLRWKVKMHFKEDEYGLYGKYSRIAIYRDRIYFYGEANDSTWYLFAYNTDGKFLWKYKLEKKPADIIPITKDGCVHPVIRYEYSVVPTKNSRSYVYSITPNGMLKWKLNISRYITLLVSDRNGYLYFSSSKALSDREVLIGLYRISPDGDYEVLYESTQSVYNSEIYGYTYIGSNEKIYCIFLGLGYFYLYTFGDNPYAFLNNPLFLSVISIVIAIPVIYFVIKKRKRKEVVKE